MKVAMLVPGLSRHDAVSNDARGMAAAMRRDGHDVVMFALHARGVDDEVRDPQSISSWLASPQDMLVYHYCVGWDLAYEVVARSHAKRVVRYHNITPPEFFRDWSESYVAACEQGRAQIDAFARLACDLYLGDSPFNIEDFTSRGVSPASCDVLPPFHEIEQLCSLEPEARRLPRGAPLLLTVGRLAPNKGHMELLDALAACVRAGAGEAHLLIIGKLDPNLASYGEALLRRIQHLGLQSRVTILQDANGSELRAAFERATAFVMPSMHEGFCVPLVEAMALGTPIVALGSSAIPWTIGGAGLVWEAPDPEVFAASVTRLMRDVELREILRSRGRERYASTFATSVLEEGLRSTMRRVAQP